MKSISDILKTRRKIFNNVKRDGKAGSGHHLFNKIGIAHDELTAIIVAAIFGGIFWFWIFPDLSTGLMNWGLLTFGILNLEWLPELTLKFSNGC
jgi:hypothetical protein